MFVSRDSSSSQSTNDAGREAAEAARKAAEEAARKAREEAARKAREEAARQAALADRRENGAVANPFTATSQTLQANPGTSTAARAGVTVSDLAAGGGSPRPPLPPGAEAVTVHPGDGGRALADAWALAGTNDLGMADPYVFQDYMARNEAGLQKLGDVIATPPPLATVDDIISGQI